MARDRERIDRLEIALKEAGLDAIACALPANVLLLTGYFPVIGRSLAVMTRDREVTLIVPEDERELADSDTADNLVTFHPEAADGFGRAIAQLRLDGAVVGYECGATMEPVSYVSLHLYGTTIMGLFGGAVLRPASELLARMKAVLTDIELDRVRRACRIAAIAFECGTRELRVGLKETEAAARFRVPL